MKCCARAQTARCCIAYQGDGAAGYCRKRRTAGWPYCAAAGGRAIDVRVSTMPSAWGERVVLRLLDKNQAA
ncbi:type II secretion system E domain protein [Escherichia coli]|nr:type II secretion system E domain protein [Escherichia coli]